MTQVCTCTHLRRDHEGGKHNLSRFGVHECMVEECKCTKYYPSRESLAEMEQLSYTYLKNVLLVMLAASLLVVGAYFLMLESMEGLTVVSDKTGLDHYNTTSTIPGSQTKTTKYADLVVSTGTGIALLVAFGAVLCFVFWQGVIYDRNKKAAILGDSTTKSENRQTKEAKSSS